MPFQEYRIRLVRLIDRLIALLDRDPTFHSFMLDGQMVILEDYLHIRPNRQPDLKRLVEAGKLFVGPWYVLADEFLVSPEALIRNLQLGLEMASQYGRPMLEGYTPDSFGHIAQLPQILRGFGIESCIFWRGFGDEADTLGNEFIWDGLDGSSVLAVHLRDGYHNIANLGYPNRGSDRSAMVLDEALALKQLQAAVDLLKPTAQTRYLLLLDGVDHAEANADIPRLIALGNEKLEDVEIVHGTLPAYIAHLREEIGRRELPSFCGEFNRGKYAHVLQSVYSTRIYLKQANDRAQTLLESYVEPFCALAWGLGHDHPTALLQEGWRLLLKNHPHDDICGCSVDAVHREDMQRFAEVEQIGRVLARDAFRQIMAHLPRDQWQGEPIVVFNPTSWQHHDWIELTLNFHQNEAEKWREFELIDSEGETIPYQLLGWHDDFVVELRKNRYRRNARIVVQLPHLPAVGYSVFYALPSVSATLPQQKVRRLSVGMENDRLQLTLNPDGTFNLLDKTTVRVYRHLGYFLDEEDAGDEYDYAPCAEPQRLTTQGKSAEIRLVEEGPLRVTYQITHQWALPVSLSADRQRRASEKTICTVTTKLSLSGDNGYIECQTTVQNQAKDHRLRVCFPSGIVSDVASADGHFAVITRPIATPDQPTWVQPPVPTHHQRVFVDVSDGLAGLAVFNRGLPEYEIIPQDNTIAVTLLRCVDLLFRDDLLSRPGYAWLPAYTPDAQCLGTHHFEYAVAPHKGAWQQIYAQAHRWHTPVYWQSGNEQEGFLPVEAVPHHRAEANWFAETALHPVDLSGEWPAEASFVHVSPAQVVITAIKQSRDEALLVVRLCNMSDQAVSADLHTLFSVTKAYELNLNEVICASLPQLTAISLGAWQVKTVGLYLERGTPRPLRRLG